MATATNLVNEMYSAFDQLANRLRNDRVNARPFFDVYDLDRILNPLRDQYRKDLQVKDLVDKLPAQALADIRRKTEDAVYELSRGLRDTANLRPGQSLPNVAE